MTSDFEEVKELLGKAEHMLYVTYPVLKDNRLLIKILEEIYRAVGRTIRIIMEAESESGRIRLSENAEINQKIFEKRCAVRYGLSKDEIIVLNQIINLFNKHKDSPAEFSRPNKFVILLDDLQTESITAQRLKTFIEIAKELLKKAEIYLRMNFA